MRYLTGAVIGALLLVSSAAAQVQQGDQEIQLLGSITAFESNALINLQFTYGIFPISNLEVGVGPRLSYFKSGGNDYTQFGCLFFGRYNFSLQEKLIPYVGGQLYQYDFAPDEPMDFIDATFVQVGAGVKFFTSEHVAYDFSGNVGFSLGEFDPSITLLGGLSYFF